MTDEQRVVANKLAKQREYFTHLAPIGETNKTKTICFDLGFLEGLYSLENKQVIDVMELFAPIYGEVSEKYGGYKWQKLQNCADYFGYKFKTHDSYEDAKATLYCYHKIMERKEV